MAFVFEVHSLHSNGIQKLYFIQPITVEVMNEDKFTNVYRLPGSLQIRIATWQQTFKGTSDLVLHQVLTARNNQYKQADFCPKGWCVNLFDESDISITQHGTYIQTSMRTMIDRKISYKRVYLSRLPLEKAEPALLRFKKEWIHNYNNVAQEYNKRKKKEFMAFAREEVETLYPAIPKEPFDKALWNRLVVSIVGHANKFNNPYFVKHADF
ncbi:hypothetical protein EAY27_04965 [Vibrio anguillarum]|uniref:MSHA operon transcriptional regulator n=1 Tax=Vibrio anguillarum TaxID=55601 RepID=UPI001889C614|nr:hypothetical protein [Vibrio anguillarum]MBF4255239.1 hypothetical protein [Vibrio anguillarum]MBF4276558.1 hypothetical protein [Vibrio anguillarum]MBF4299483.1 hypothetical protein [Vibrio anguillarum]MBF4362191.1 hypothetical protein [Vibrio anguillarum]MBF4398867.1 hypothetical protein [Vibrio anguillarum]